MASIIRVNCPNCNSTLEAQEEWLGMKTSCPNCNQEFEITAPNPPEKPSTTDLLAERRNSLANKRAEQLQEKKKLLGQREKRKKIERFFHNTYSKKSLKWIGIFLIVLGVVTLVFGIGILIVAMGGYIVWLASRATLDETEFDLYAAEDMAYIETLNILEQYGKDPSELVAPPYTMIAPDFEGAGLVEFNWRLGEDGEIRYSVIEITKAFMFEHQLLVFSASWDFIKGILMNEKTHAFFYKDIVAINTSSEYAKTTNAWLIQLIGMIPFIGEHIAAFMKEKITVYKTAEAFELISSSGNSISLTVGFDQWILAHGGQVPDKTEAEAMIRSVRKMVEEKKKN